MSRVVVELPPSFPFSTEMEVRISQVNAGNHLGNDSIVGILNEARLRFMKWLGYTDATMAGYNYINADLAIAYKGEAHYADQLLVEVACDNFGKYGCDFLFRISHKESGREVANAKAAFLLYDYEKQALVKAPPGFAEMFQKTPDR